MAAIGTLPVLFSTGNHASRPAASAVGKGGLYSCTTHGLVYQTDGSTWSTWATLGTSGAYAPGGTDVALADGGTGASLTDPNADRILFWDDSAGQVTWLTAGTNLTITSTTIDASGGGSTELLALKVYAPTSQTVYSTSSATQADIDATNLAVTFTAPASGNVLVRFSAWIDSGTSESYIGLRESTTDLACITRVLRAQSPAGEQYLSVPMYVSGISGGSHTYKVSYSTAGATFRVIIQDGSATGEWGPGIIEVWAAP